MWMSIYATSPAPFFAVRDQKSTRWWRRDAYVLLTSICVFTLLPRLTNDICFWTEISGQTQTLFLHPSSFNFYPHFKVTLLLHTPSALPRLRLGFKSRNAVVLRAVLDRLPRSYTPLSGLPIPPCTKATRNYYNYAHTYTPRLLDYACCSDGCARLSSHSGRMGQTLYISVCNMRIYLAN